MLALHSLCAFLIHAADPSEQGEGDELLQAIKVVKSSIFNLKCIPGNSQWVISVEDTSVDGTGGSGWNVSRVKFLTNDANGFSHELSHNSNPSCSLMSGGAHPFHQVNNAFEDTGSFYLQTSKDSSAHNLGFFVGVSCNHGDFGWDPQGRAQMSPTHMAMAIQFEGPCGTEQITRFSTNYKVLFRQCGGMDPSFDENRPFTQAGWVPHAPSCGELSEIFSNEWGTTGAPWRETTGTPPATNHLDTTFISGVLRNVAAASESVLFDEESVAAAWCRENNVCVGYVHAQMHENVWVPMVAVDVVNAEGVESFLSCIMEGVLEHLSVGGMLAPTVFDVKVKIHIGSTPTPETHCVADGNEGHVDNHNPSSHEVIWKVQATIRKVGR